MASREPDVVAVAGRSLRLPLGISAQLLSDQRSADAVDAFVRSSPDHTVYHRPPYIDFARRQNGVADLMLLSSHGQPLAAIPFHPGPRRVSTGYAGVCFPPGGQAALRRALGALGDVARLNRRFRLQSLQSAQAPAVDDTNRSGFLAFLLDTLDVRQEPLHTRLLRIRATATPTDTSPSVIAVDPDDLVGMGGYDGDLRNQVRQAARRGVTAEVMVIRDAAEAATAYQRFLPIHTASWQRTGMRAHGLDYLLGLEEAVRVGGGHDVLVFAHAPTGAAVAAVSCHVYGERAIYWSGCSLPEALPLRANPFCLHAAVEAMRRMGVTAFEMGRFSAAETDPKEISVTRYKAQFGGDVQRVLNFEFGAPLVDAHGLGRTARNRARRWMRRR
ncbi:MAG: GNAT family N-acetyltransferase [Candidatus Dormibacteraeota bacterium]|nr:GNAT family N-acetyltransferase [Candidatus Dormibacteraeota bacterium]